MISQYVFIFVLSINYCEREFPQISHHCNLWTFSLFSHSKLITSETATVLTISLFTTIPPILPLVFILCKYPIAYSKIPDLWAFLNFVSHHSVKLSPGGICRIPVIDRGLLFREPCIAKDLTVLFGLLNAEDRFLACV